ncbi:hypothetical protein ACFE04_031474 [Oxalis oulophora]
MAFPFIISIILSLCCSLFILFYSTLFLINKHKYKNLPPGPPTLPIIGNLHQLGPLAHRSLEKLSKKYGPILFLRFGAVPTVIASSVDSAREVLKTHDLQCCSRPLLAATAKVSYNYRDVAFSPYSDYWREMRKICVLELFSAKRVQSFGFIREEQVDLMIKSISDLLSSKETQPVVIDIREMLTSLTADTTYRICFGKSIREKEGIDSKKLQRSIIEASALMGSFYASDGMIDDHLSINKPMEQREDDIIDVLLDLQRNESKLTHNHIKAVLMNIFSAGIDTVVNTIEWVMAELIKNPRAMNKVQEEIRNRIGNKGKVSQTDIHNFSYLKMVIKEVFRLHPVGVLLIPREAISEFQINGYNIYPGTRILVNVWAIGRDPSIWTDPEVFFPERFVDDNIDYKGQNFELLPFGGGRRGCPGILWATSVVELALANLLYSFDWKLPNEMRVEDFSMEEKPGLSITRKKALTLVPIKYEFAASVMNMN